MWGNAHSPHSLPSFPSLPFLPLPCPPLPSPAAKRPPENQLWFWGTTARLLHFGVFWAWKSHLATTCFVINLSLKRCILKHFTNALRKKNNCIGKKCRNGVLTFKKVAERRSRAFWLNLSTDPGPNPHRQVGSVYIAYNVGLPKGLHCPYQRLGSTKWLRNDPIQGPDWTVTFLEQELEENSDSG